MPVSLLAPVPLGKAERKVKTSRAGTLMATAAEGSLPGIVTE